MGSVKKMLLSGMLTVVVLAFPVACQPHMYAQPIVTAGPLTIQMSYVHTQPGVYSEVSALVKGPPGISLNLTLNGPAVTPPTSQTLTFGPDGTANFTWKITKFGQYSVTGLYDDLQKTIPVTDTVVVQ